ncbi:diguanylate cyclase [Psychrobacter sp. YP14]|jgi:GAF domain-containing protein|uniref:GAF domain-containing protein n=2 Tax=Psychrobacter TaxID=497 RepID=A0A844M209_9GAMM|nr:MULTISPECIES: GAF domain-containing protein [Psychrobacter]AWT49643.1 diguanylate cyclase [Psychrobacter sp. YP14]MUG32981.1 GAF domain-containing protein [Psychrobacter sanguinis]UNK05015.1 GAF domain-containing protein [Psychrobacter sp. PraFG1]
MQAINPIDPNTNKAEKYQLLLKQAEAIVSSESDLIANMANLTALLKDTFNWFWIGFYRVDSSANQLILGPFQGPLACTRIPHGKGVCGEVWATGTTQIVDDVNAHPNHIACSSLSQSEIVVPITDEAGEIIAVLDIDSDTLATFDEVDGEYLQQLVDLLK